MSKQVRFAMDDKEVIERAIVAWCRRAEIPTQPSASDSTIDEHGGRQYVVLRNVSGVLGVYRVHPDGRLAFESDPPAAIAGEDS